MEGIFNAMLFFFGVKFLLAKQSKDKDMSKRGKRKNKFKPSATEQELNEVVRKSERERLKEEAKGKKPFEMVKLLPPREAQRKPDDM